MNSQYSDQFYSNRGGTLLSARHIVPLVKEYVPVTSAVDIGCGLGEFLKVFSENGASTVLGVDGPWVKREKLLIKPEEFVEADLTKPFTQPRQFDLVISCEVGEHLPDQASDIFVQSLTDLGNVVLFSAAIPLQGGTYHVNEQWPEYWAAKFQQHGFVAIDCLRLAIWNNPEIKFWYKQNLILFVRKDSLSAYPKLQMLYDPNKPLLPLVHPHIFSFYAKNYHSLTQWIPTWLKALVKNLSSYNSSASMSVLLYGKAFKGLRKSIKYLLSAAYPLVKSSYRFPTVKSIDETIDFLLTQKASISRYGDSELLFIIDRVSLPYQVFDEKLRQRLIEILVSDYPGHTVGLPIGYHSLKNLIPDSVRFWRSQITWTHPRLQKYLNLDKVYYNTNMTRVYVTFDDKKDCPRIFASLMKLWQGREVLLIEGERSRLGMGNDLFSQTTQVKRILAPQHHAFAKYDDILKEALKYPSTYLVLIALGPTATVLAYDLARKGYQALDVGNVDIEYEWFLRGATSKVKIHGKYTSEAAGGRVVEDVVDTLYQQQIVSRIL